VRVFVCVCVCEGVRRVTTGVRVGGWEGGLQCSARAGVRCVACVLARFFFLIARARTTHALATNRSRYIDETVRSCEKKLDAGKVGAVMQCLTWVYPAFRVRTRHMWCFSVCVRVRACASFVWVWCSARNDRSACAQTLC
jgi:hypothetical protein